MSDIKVEIRELTLMQEQFCYEYMKNGGRGADAARKAGYTEDCAKEMAYELKSLPHVQTRIEQLKDRIRLKHMTDIDYMIERLRYWADKKDLGCATSTMKALDLLGKYLHMFDERSTITIKTHEQSLDELE